MTLTDCQTVLLSLLVGYKKEGNENLKELQKRNPKHHAFSPSTKYALNSQQFCFQGSGYTIQSFLIQWQITSKFLLMFIYGTFFYLLVIFFMDRKQEENTQHTTYLQKYANGTLCVNFTAQWSDLSCTASSIHLGGGLLRVSSWCCLCVKRLYKQDKFKWRHYVLREKAPIRSRCPASRAHLWTECRERKQASPFIFTLQKVVFQTHVYSQTKWTAASLGVLITFRKVNFLSLTEAQRTEYFNSFPASWWEKIIDSSQLIQNQNAVERLCSFSIMNRQISIPCFASTQ